MATNSFLQVSDIADDPHSATKFVVDLLFHKVWPLIKTVRLKLQSPKALEDEDLNKKLSDVFSVCCSQLKKCIIGLFQIFQLENKNHLILHDSRQFTMDRLAWCMNRLGSIDQTLDANDLNESDNSFLVTPMYFVNWIDHAFEILTKLSDLVYRTDYRSTEELYEIWKSEVVEIVEDLQLSLDELLLSAMTLCRYCLPSDQLIVRARCQVVLREAKSLLSELITEDINTAYKVTKSLLKLPMMPSNMSVLIDVLKDALFVLETNTNTALLALLVHCFSKVSPVDELSEHLKDNKGDCSCKVGDVEDCAFIKEFDLHNERLMQIGTFAISCSSDQIRISSVRSGLASLEALDPHLVPALLLPPCGPHAAPPPSAAPHPPVGPHAALLAACWTHELREIRDNVFLIVDPAAFSDKCKQMMHEELLRIISQEKFEEQPVCTFTNIGGVFLDFFNVYKEKEPDALMHQDMLLPIVVDLTKALAEVKIVINMLSPNKMIYQVKMPQKIKEEANFSKLEKRLKLLYTLVSRINALFYPKEIEDQFFEICEPKNVTHVVNKDPINGATYVNSPRKETNASRTFFARTSNVRTPSNKHVLKKLSQHLNAKRNGELSFSVKIDEMFQITDSNDSNKKEVVNKYLNSVREKSILYHSPQKNKSLRKAVLSRQCKGSLLVPKVGNYEIISKKLFDSSDENDFIDETTSLQITEILDQMNDMSTVLHDTQTRRFSSTRIAHSSGKNVLKIDVNKEVTFKKIWNIPVNSSEVEVRLDETVVKGDASERSDVTTQERLHDLDLVEDRLSRLKMCQQETSL